MIDQAQITNQLHSWLETFVEQPNAQLGNWPPCPFARRARINGMIGINFCEVQEFDSAVSQAIELLNSKDVVVICFDHTDISVTDLQSWVQNKNAELMPDNYVILEDHPNDVEFVNNVKMNFGHCGLLVIQKLDKLNSASLQLRSQGYYDHWDHSALEQVVNWRFK